MQILTFPDYDMQARRLADRLQVDCQLIELHHFPDGESLVRLPTALEKQVIICRSLNQPNDKLVELLLTARTARQFGAERLTLVAPYLCYMRQDTANRPGEAVSQRIIGQLLADLFDDVITVDPHLHRIDRLTQAIPLENAIALSATDEIAAFLQEQVTSALLLGPDEESEQWVRRIAEKTGFDYAVARKQRLGDKSVVITLPERDVSGRQVVLVDDVASTGRTLAKTTEALKKAGAGEVMVAITHALFCGDAEKALLQAGVDKIWSTDSISHHTAGIHLDQLLARAIIQIMA
jgi:ribose-phosphate pyrophosphokinase